MDIMILSTVKKNQTSAPGSAHRRLNSGENDNRIKKGRIPVLVGLDTEEMERVSISAKLMKHPYILGLLEVAAHEFGYTQQGTLMLPCDASSFKRMIHLISKGK